MAHMNSMGVVVPTIGTITKMQQPTDGSIRMEMDEMVKLLAELHAALDDLAIRTNPVRVIFPEGPISGEEKGPTPPHSELLLRVREGNRIIALITSRVRDLTDSIDL